MILRNTVASVKFFILLCANSYAKNNFKQELQYCNDFPKTEEFKKLEKFTIVLDNTQKLDFYYDKKLEEVVYVDRRVELKKWDNIVKNNPNTFSETAFCVATNKKIYNFRDLLDYQREIILQEYRYDYNCYDVYNAWKDKAGNVDKYLCECDKLQIFSLMLNDLSCKVENIKYSKLII